MPRTKKQNRKYYLHRFLRKQGVELNVSQKMVIIPSERIEVADLKQVCALNTEYGYTKQVKMQLI
jgi:hypothetical protein